jgi:hypothetical protein
MTTSAVAGLGEGCDRLTAEKFRVQIAALILSLLIDLYGDAVGIGPRVLSDAVEGDRCALGSDRSSG